MNDRLETHTPITGDRSMGLLSIGSMPSVGLDIAPFWVGRCNVVDAGSARTPFGEGLGESRNLVQVPQQNPFVRLRSNSLKGIYDSPSTLISLDCIFAPHVSSSMVWISQDQLGFFEEDLVSEEILRRAGDFEREDEISAAEGELEFFFDETGSPFSFANMPASSTEELQDLGFPFYSPSEDSPETLESLRQILSKRR